MKKKKLKNAKRGKAIAIGKAKSAEEDLTKEDPENAEKVIQDNTLKAQNEQKKS